MRRFSGLDTHSPLILNARKYVKNVTLLIGFFDLQHDMIYSLPVALSLHIQRTPGGIPSRRRHARHARTALEQKLRALDSTNKIKCAGHHQKYFADRFVPHPQNGWSCPRSKAIRTASIVDIEKSKSGNRKRHASRSQKVTSLFPA